MRVCVCVKTGTPKIAAFLLLPLGTNMKRAHILRHRSKKTIGPKSCCRHVCQAPGSAPATPRIDMCVFHTMSYKDADLHCASAALQADCAASRCKMLPASCYTQIALTVALRNVAVQVALFELVFSKGAPRKLLLRHVLCTCALRKLLCASLRPISASALRMLCAICAAQVLCVRD